MPTIHREGGFSFRVFPNDHPPAHVHAWSRGDSVVVALPIDNRPAPVLAIFGQMKDADVKQAMKIVQDDAEIMWEGWRRFHDQETH